MLSIPFPPTRATNNTTQSALAAPKMALPSFLTTTTTRPSFSFPPIITIKSHLTPFAVLRTQPSSSSSSSQSLSINPNSNNNNPIPDPSLTCALQCEHFDSCSGCSHEWNLHRPIMLDEATEFFRNLGVSNFRIDSCRLWGWRCRAKLAIRGTSSNPLIGLYQEGTHNVVDIPFCQAHHPNINAAVELLREGITQLDVEPYDEDEETGELRYVQMAVSTYTTSLPASERYLNGKVQIALVWNSRNENSPSSEKLNALANFLWRNSGSGSKFHLIHSVWVNFQTSTSNDVLRFLNVLSSSWATSPSQDSIRMCKIIFGNRWRHLIGERDFWEHVGGIDISLAPSSFGQANTQAFDSLLQKLHKYVPYGASVTDLYAGAGVIGLSLAVARKCRSVKCVEINKESKLSFEKTISRLPKSVDSNISWHQADTSIEPLSWLEGSEVVVVDPPRKGLDPSLVDTLRKLASFKRKPKTPESVISTAKDEKRPWILRAREASVQIESKTTWEESQSLPETLIYISCGWESFKEDCRSLLSSRTWRLEKAHGFNFFPGTESIEVLAVFKRTPGPGVKKKKTGKKKKKLQK